MTYPTRTISYFLILLVMAVGFAEAQTAGSLDVLFTGRTFGYLRLDDPSNKDVAVSVDHCAAVPTPVVGGKLANSCEVKLFLNELMADVGVNQLEDLRRSTGSANKPVLVGLGDNFGPRLEARMFLDGNFWRWRSRNPQLDLSSLSPKDYLRADPVAQLLISAGYNALVPGREDFGLGPERLRNVANYMRCEPDNEGVCQPDHTVHMLAANLFIATTYKKTRDPLPEDQRGLKFKTKHSLIQPLSSGPFLPLLQHLSFKLSVNSAGLVPMLDTPPSPIKICGPFDDPDYFDPTRCQTVEPEIKVSSLAQPEILRDFQPELDRMFSGVASARMREQTETVKMFAFSTGWVPVATVRQRHSQSGGRFQMDYGEKLLDVNQKRSSLTLRVPTCSPAQQGTKCLQPDRNYLLCFYEPEERDPAAKPNAKPNKTLTEPYCQRIPVSRPFFQDDFVYLDRGGDENDVLILGITDPSLNTGLSDSAGSWLKRQRKTARVQQSSDPYVCDAFPSDCSDPGRKIKVDTSEPSVVIGQVLDFAAGTCLSDPSHSALWSGCLRRGSSFRGKKILLTQLDALAAGELHSHLTLSSPIPGAAGRFDLVFAKADGSHTTPSLIRIDRPGPPSPVLVPRPISDDQTEKLYRAISQVSLAISDNGGRMQRTIEVRSPAETCDIPRDCYRPAEPSPTDTPGQWSLNTVRDRLSEAARKYLCGLSGQETDDEVKEVRKQFCQEPTASQRLLTSTNSSYLTEAILQAMRKASNADVAVLEKRELFTLLSTDDILSNDTPPNAILPLQKIIDRILWEGSTLQKVTVTGASLKAILKRSQQYSQVEGSTIIFPQISGLSLLYAGIRPGAGKDEYIVNGTLIDDAKPYSIATTDRPITATGDYPELNKQVNGETSEVDSSLTARYISHVVCEGLAQANTTLLGAPNAACDLRNPIQAGSPVIANATPADAPGMRYFASCPNREVGAQLLYGGWGGQQWNQCDPGMLGPPDTKSRGWKDWGYDLESWTAGRQRAMPEAIRSIPELSEAATQLEPNAELKVSEMSVAFTDFNPSLSAAQLNNTFPAPALATVNQSQTTSWAIVNTTRYRAMRSLLFGAFHESGIDQYSSLDVSYASQKQEKTSGPVVSRTHNEWAVVPLGWEFAIPGLATRSSRLDPREFIVFEPDRLRGELKPDDNYYNVQFVALPNQNCAGRIVGANCELTQHLQQDQTFAWTPRVGFRYENKVSYAEIGYQSAYNWRLPRAFLFNSPNSPNYFACPDPNNLVKCLSANGPSIMANTQATEVHQHNWQDGPYLDSVIRIPLPPFKKGFYYNIKNKDEFFRHGADDTASLTRYDLTMTHSLTIPIIWNLSLNPTVELFWYENQVNHDTLFRQSYLIKLNWTLDDRFKRIPKNQTAGYSPFSAASTPAK